MKCELCHKADAETVIRKIVGEEEQELFVCHKCAHERPASESTARQQAGDAADAASAEEGVASLPLMSMILDAAFEIVGRAMNVTEPTCPACGITRSEYRKASRLGCPACYDAFSKELETAIQDLHRSLQHVGKAPERGKVARQMARLQAELAEAVKSQRYEDAIALRDRIRRLSGAGPAQDGGGAC